MEDLQALDLWLSFIKTGFTSCDPRDEIFFLYRPVELLRLRAVSASGEKKDKREEMEGLTTELPRSMRSRPGLPIAYTSKMVWFCVRNVVLYAPAMAVEISVVGRG